MHELCNNTEDSYYSLSERSSYIVIHKSITHGPNNQMLRKEVSKQILYFMHFTKNVLSSLFSQEKCNNKTETDFIIYYQKLIIWYSQISLLVFHYYEFWLRQCVYCKVLLVPVNSLSYFYI